MPNLQAPSVPKTQLSPSPAAARISSEYCKTGTRGRVRYDAPTTLFRSFPMRKHRLIPLARAPASSPNRPPPADPLAARAPADAVAFVSWAGADALGKGYEDSH